MVALEDQFQTRIDETKFAGAKTLDDLRAVIAAAPQEAEVAEPVDFPSWNRAWPVRVMRRISQATWILPLARSSRGCVSAGSNTSKDQGPVVFASNHQSHFDVPVILIALPGSSRATVAPAMAKEFFKAHFFPESFRRGRCSPTGSTTTCRRSSSTPSRCRNVKPARGRRCVTSAR